MSKKTKYEIEIPFFPGYYESVLYNSDTLYWEFHDEDNMEWYRERFEDDTLTEDDLDLDFDGYRKEVNEQFISAFEWEMDNAMQDFIKEIEFSDMTSPKYYNNKSDRLFVNVELCEDWQERILAFMEENKEWLSERIAKDWTSYDGFMSFMDNTYDEWVKRMSEDEPDWLYLSVMLGYIIYLNNNNVRDSMAMSALEDVYIGNYVINLKEEKKVE